MPNGEILTRAHALINSDRQAEYGPPAESFDRIASLWSAYLGQSISPRDVAICMALLKLGRESFKHKEDNLLDAAGYIGLADELPGLDGIKVHVLAKQIETLKKEADWLATKADRSCPPANIASECAPRDNCFSCWRDAARKAVAGAEKGNA